MCFGLHAHISATCRTVRRGVKGVGFGIHWIIRPYYFARWTARVLEIGKYDHGCGIHGRAVRLQRSRTGTVITTSNASLYPAVMTLRHAVVRQLIANPHGDAELS
jgi:hypothetical protein